MSIDLIQFLWRNISDLPDWISPFASVCDVLPLDPSDFEFAFLCRRLRFSEIFRFARVGRCPIFLGSAQDRISLLLVSLCAPGLCHLPKFSPFPLRFAACEYS
jgi:hypothetical protein